MAITKYRLIQLDEDEWTPLRNVWPISDPMVYTTLPPKYSPQYKIMQKGYFQIFPDYIYYIIVGDNIHESSSA